MSAELTHSCDHMNSAEFLGQFVGIVGSEECDVMCTGCGDTSEGMWSLALIEWVVKHIRECGAKGGAMVTLRNAE